MPFAYFDRLSPDEQLVYLASDLVTGLRLRGAAELAPSVSAIERGLARGDRYALQRAASRLVRSMCATFEVRPPRVEILEARPTFTGGELHGLYTWEKARRATIQVWMRTARFGRVVAFRTFLRTLLHELLHHLDLRLLRLPLSFHTQGFYKRESSLFHQLVPGARRSTPRPEVNAPLQDPPARRRARGASRLRPPPTRDRACTPAPPGDAPPASPPRRSRSGSR